MPSFDFTIVIIKIVLVIGIPILLLPLNNYFERKILHLTLDAKGSLTTRSNFLFRPFADFVKLFFKKESRPNLLRYKLDKLFPFLYLQMGLAPLLGISFCGPIELKGKLIFPEVFTTEMGLFYIYLLICLGPICVLVSSWSLQNVYSVILSVRKIYHIASYQMIITLSLISAFFVYGEMDVHKIVTLQSQTFWLIFPQWGLFIQPIGGLLFFFGLLIFNSKSNLNISSPKYELIKGFFNEHSSIEYIFIKFAEFLFLFEFIWLFVIIYLGGYNIIPGLDLLLTFYPKFLNAFQVLSLLLKMGLLISFINIIQRIIPQLRIDQILGVSWKILFPIAICNFFGTIFLKYWQY